jgi:hypothetical protein
LILLVFQGLRPFRPFRRSFFAVPTLNGAFGARQGHRNALAAGLL